MGITVRNFINWIGQLVSGGTSGSILYVDSNKNLAQDNANLFYDASNHRIGITTATPAYLIDSGTTQMNINGNGLILRTGTTNMIFIAGGTSIRMAASVVVGTVSANPDASAVLEVNSTTKGLLLPRLTTTQKNAISSPAAGLMVYDTTLGKASLFTGSIWETMTSA